MFNEGEGQVDSPVPQKRDKNTLGVKALSCMPFRLMLTSYKLMFPSPNASKNPVKEYVYRSEMNHMWKRKDLLFVIYYQHSSPSTS